MISKLYSGQGQHSAHKTSFLRLGHMIEECLPKVGIKIYKLSQAIASYFLAEIDPYFETLVTLLTSTTKFWRIYMYFNVFMTYNFSND